MPITEETASHGASPDSLMTRFITGLNAIAGYLLFFMMLLITVDVTRRYLFNNPIAGTLEGTEFLMVFVVFCSMAYVQQQKQHIRVELVTSRLPRTMQALLAIATLIIAALFFCGIAWYSWIAAMSSLEYNEASEGLVQIPIYPPKFAIAIGSAIMVLQLLRDMLGQFKLLTTKE